ISSTSPTSLRWQRPTPAPPNPSRVPAPPSGRWRCCWAAAANLSKAAASGAEQGGHVGQVSLHRRAVGPQTVEQPLQVADMRQHRPVEHHARTHLHQQGRKILDVFVAQQVGVIFDVDPRKYTLSLGMGQRRKTRPILAAGIAPGRAAAGHQPAAGARPRQGRAERGGAGSGHEQRTGINSQRILDYDTRHVFRQVFPMIPPRPDAARSFPAHAAAAGTAGIAQAFKRALVSQFHPNMLLAVLLPFVIALLGALLLLWLFWTPLTDWLNVQ